MLITNLLFITGVVYTLVFLITFYIEKRYTESALPFFFAIIVFGYAFAYRHLLLQQKKKGKNGNPRLMAQLRGLGLLLFVLGFLYIVVLWIIGSANATLPVYDPVVDEGFLSIKDPLLKRIRYSCSVISKTLLFDTHY